MTNIKFKMAAKTDVGRIRTNNEDNFQMSWDLSSLPMRWVNNEIHQLGDKGCLLVVADGMGGANAGEVASAIAIDSIKASFSPDKITGEVISSTESINSFIKAAIVDADKAIKDYYPSHPETKGMGTTIVIAWVLQGNLYLGWCGDSRAYLFNKASGLKRLSKDHSYVQGLVDAGKISEDDAFDFPDSNIITQCLSAMSQKAKPDTLSKPVELYVNDIILLCTDGLCGMIRDNEIKDVLENSGDNLTQTANELVNAALEASGSDNVTICLCEILSGVKAIPVAAKSTDNSGTGKKRNWTLYYLIGILGVVLIGMAVWLAILLSEPDVSERNEDVPTEQSSGARQQNEPTQTIPVTIEPGEIQTGVPVQHKERPEAVNPPADDNVEPTQPGLKPDLEGKLRKLEGRDSGPKDEGGIDQTDEQSKEETTPTPPAERETIVITLKTGDTMTKIMKEYKMTVKEIKDLNPGINLDKVKEGEQITVYKK